MAKNGLYKTNSTKCIYTVQNGQREWTIQNIQGLYKTNCTKRGGRYDFYQILWRGNQTSVAFRSYIIFQNPNIPNFHSPLKPKNSNHFKTNIPTSSKTNTPSLPKPNSPTPIFSLKVRNNMFSHSKLTQLLYNWENLTIQRNYGIIYIDIKEEKMIEFKTGKCPKCNKLGEIILSNNPLSPGICINCLNTEIDYNNIKQADFFCRTYNIPFDPNK